MKTTMMLVALFAAGVAVGGDTNVVVSSSTTNQVGEVGVKAKEVGKEWKVPDEELIGTVAEAPVVRGRGKGVWVFKEEDRERMGILSAVAREAGGIKEAAEVHGQLLGELNKQLAEINAMLGEKKTEEKVVEASVSHPAVERSELEVIDQELDRVEVRLKKLREARAKHPSP